MRLSLPIIATNVLPSSVIYLCPLSLITHIYYYKIVAIVRRVFNGSAVRVVSYLVKLYVGVAYSVHSEF